MRRRFFWGLAAVTAALAVVAGSGTFGFFSSSTFNPGNRFLAGTLILGNNLSGTFILRANNLQPGDSLSGAVTLSRDPASTLDMNYSVVRTIDIDSALCDALNIVVTRTDAGQDLDDGAAVVAGTVISAGADTLRSFAAAALGTWSLNNSGNSTDTYNFQVTFTDTGAPQNALQGLTCEVTYTWSAIQQTVNDEPGIGL